MRTLLAAVSICLSASMALGADECGREAVSVNKVTVPLKAVHLRAAPSSKAPKVVNPKATEAFRRTMYAQVDPSTTVMEVCRKGTWSFVTLVEPPWLRDSHRGWVTTSAIGTVLVGKSGKRIYRESEIGWGTDTAPYKKDLMFAINGFVQDRCDEQLDTYSLARSPTRGTDADPVFFIACGSPPNAENIYFSRSDIRRHRRAK